MKVKDLLEVCKHADIELHSGFDGALLAKSKKGFEKYSDAEITSFYPRIKVSEHGKDYATVFLYVFIAYKDVLRLRGRLK